MDSQLEEFDSKPFLITQSGKKVWADMTDFEVEDIAHALSRICRFNGHCRGFYSVAEHSVVMARLLLDGKKPTHFHGDKRIAKSALLHDASEAYLGDVVHVLKRSAPLEQFRAFDEALQERIYARFLGDRFKVSTRIDELDRLLVVSEAYKLCHPSLYRQAFNVIGVEADTAIHFPEWEPDVAKSAWLDLWEELK